MINFDIMTLFPEIINSYKLESMMKRACDANHINVNTYNFRDYSDNKHKKVDDYPYSGGGGMLLTPQPIFSCFDDIKSKYDKTPYFVYMSPKGKILDNEIINRLTTHENITILCGHYEGVDQRVIDQLVDEEISIGDYVLTGGELPALVLIDSLMRTIDGVLGKKDGHKEESHYNGLLEHPQYTRPYEYKGMKVPDILLSGHEANIKKWKRLMQIKYTILQRPDIEIEKYATKEEINEAKNI